MNNTASVQNSNEPITLHWSDTKDGDAPIGACGLADGGSATVYKPADFDPANPVYCQTAHCGRGKSHFIFVGLASPIVPYRNLKQTTDGITADCRSLV